jgi:hypothetical protein
MGEGGEGLEQLAEGAGGELVAGLQLQHLQLGSVSRQSYGRIVTHRGAVVEVQDAELR